MSVQVGSRPGNPAKIRSVYQHVLRDIRRSEQPDWTDEPSVGDELLTAYQTALRTCVSLRRALDRRDVGMW